MRKSFTRRIVELLVGFHPDLTEEEREKAIPRLVIVLLLWLCALLAFIAFILYLLR